MPRILLGSVLLLALSLSGCETRGGSPDAGDYLFQVGGRVSGLTGSGLVLRNNGGDDLAIPADGAFAFATELPGGSIYEVTVAQQPSQPAQTCRVTRGRGPVLADVAGVAVLCETPSYTVGGTVSGLQGTGLSLVLNGSERIVIAPAAGPVPFTFATRFDSGAPFTVRLENPPSSPSQTCELSGASGTVVGGDVGTVVVNCVVNSFTVGGTVLGLVGSGLVLENLGASPLALNANGTFAFPAPISSGGAYAVSVRTQPSSPSQTCTVSGGSGTVTHAQVTRVRVECTTNTYTVGGTITGLEGTGLVLRNNGTNDRKIDPNNNGSFTFTAPLPSGSSYEVTLATQPSGPTQTCTVSNGVGTVVSSNVRSVAVSCETVRYPVGGTVSGLAGSGLVLWNLVNGERLALSANGPFTFPTWVAEGGSYSIRVETQPLGPAQACTLTSGASGTVGPGSPANVSVQCTSNAFAIGGTVSGFISGHVLLANSNGDQVVIDREGPFAFATPLANGTSYAVSVVPDPWNAVHTCSVSNGSGTVNGAHVTSVAVTCVRSTFSVGGFVSGLTGPGLILRNGSDDLAVEGNGPFTFPTRVASGQPYSVTVIQHPVGAQCQVYNGSGYAYSDVSDISVLCGSMGPSNEDRWSATPLTLGSGGVTYAAFDTTYARNDTSGSCGCSGGADVFFSFTLSRATIFYADTAGAGFDTSLFLQDANGFNLTGSGLSDGTVCNDDGLGGCYTAATSQLLARLEAGTYYLVVSGCGAGAGTLKLNHFDAPNGESIPLPQGTSSYVVTTSGVGAVTGGCSNTNGPEVAFYFHTCPAFAGGTLNATTCSSRAVDAVLHFRGPDVVACNDDGPPVCSTYGNAATVSPSLPAGTGLFVLYGEVYNGQGTLDVSVTRP